MKKVFKKLTSTVLAFVMTASSLTFTGITVSAAAAFSSAGGWYESMYAELTGVSDSQVTSVSWTGTGTGSLTGEDLTYLVRNVNNKVRIDIPGLKPGTYTLNVYTSQGNISRSGIEVKAYDRSGYAHYQYTEGVGAYNDDGTLKSNAKVLYVTEENKNTVSLTVGSTTVTGIGNILNSAGKDNGTGVTSKGGKPNGNKGILGLLSDNNIPLVVRFIGTVKAGDSNTSNNPPAQNIDGLTAYNSVDYGGSVKDDGMMARMQGAKNITLEGIGTDTCIDGWGFHFICGTADYAKGAGKSCEVRNILFQNYPEDGFGAEGQQDDKAMELTAPVQRVWVHNNSFAPGFCKNPAESDKAEGDGSCDFKRGLYYTMSYNRYWDCHKTNLVGSSSDSLQYNMSMHHNYYNNCQARGPLARQGNIHMYNNVYVGQTDYAMNPRAGSFIYAEYNVFEKSKNPVDTTGEGDGWCAGLGNVYYACSGAQMANEVDSKAAADAYAKTTSNQYNDFIGNSYINDDSSYVLQKDAKSIKEAVYSSSGVMGSEVPDTSIVTKEPQNFVVPPYNKDINKQYISSIGEHTIDNIIFNPTKVANDSITIREAGVIFKVAQEVQVSITDGGNSAKVQLASTEGEVYITGTGVATVPAGTYVIASSVYDPGNGGAFKEAKLTHLQIAAKGEIVVPPTAAEPSTQATTKSASEQGTEATTQAVQVPPTGDKVINQSMLISRDSNSDFVYVYGDKNSSGPWKIDKSKGDTVRGYIEIKLGKKADITVKTNGDKTLLISAVNGEPNGTTVVPTGSDPITGTATGVEPGTYYLYNIEGYITVYSIDIKIDDTTATETSSETTTAAPVPSGSYKLAVGSGTVKQGEDITVPVKVYGFSNKEITSYNVTLTYDTNALTFVRHVNVYNTGYPFYSCNDNIPGKITVTFANFGSAKYLTDGSVLFNIIFKAYADADIGLSITEVYSDVDQVDAEAEGGRITVTDMAEQSLRGDADLNGKVEKADAIAVLKHISNVEKLTDPKARANADCDSEIANGIDMKDVLWILAHTSGTAEPTTEATTKAPTTTTEATTKETTTESTTADTSGLTALSAGNYEYAKVLSDTSHFKVNGNQSTKGELKINDGTDSYVQFKVNDGAIVEITYQCGSSNSGKTAWVILNGKEGEHVDHAGGQKTLTVSGLPAGVYKITAGQTGGTSATILSINVTYGSTVVTEKTTESTTAKVEKPTQTTTAKVETPTQTTTSELPPIGDEDVTLSPVPSNVVKTVTSDSLTEFKNGISALSGGGTLKIDTPVIKITGSNGLSYSGSNKAAIVGVQQPDGTYPVLDFSGLSSGKRGLTIKGSNLIVQNVIVEGAPDNGIIIDGGKNNTIEHVIARYNGDTGIQLSNNATGNILRYCYSYRNVDIGTYGANADGFAPKLGASDTTFEYCYSWDNSDDGWDSYDKEGDLGAKVVYRHSAAWNNGNPKVFTGEYDFNNNKPLDEKLTTVKQMMASDSSFASNYAKGTFNTSNAKIGGKSVSSWVSSANSAMNGNGIKFGSGTTAKDPKVVRIADYCLAFDHKSKGFDNNNTEKCTGYITNCVSFKNNINYQLPYTFAEWKNNYGWGATSSNQSKQSQTILTPSNTSAAEKSIYEVRDTIISYCYQNKFPDGITFDDVIDSF